AEALVLSGETAAARDLWERIWTTGQQPRALAALILCELMDGQTTTAPEEANESAVSSAFIAWYQRLITMRAKSVIESVNEQLDKLSRALPTAAGKIEKALGAKQEAAQGTPV